MEILSFGSLIIDNVYCVEYIVKPGETISSKELKLYPGGKGLNQSVALQKQGYLYIMQVMWGKTAVCLWNIARNMAWIQD